MNDDLDFAALVRAAFLQGGMAHIDRGLWALAVSGGGDSMAMLDMARKSYESLLCLSVDHGLRPEASSEMSLVAEYCAKHQIPHQTLKWTKPTRKGGQAAAREARYKLLLEAAGQAGAAALLTAHTEDDQAETVFARSTREDAGTKSGKGLAGIWPVRLAASGAGPTLPLVRPLLSVKRHELRRYLAVNEVPYVNDPSNEDRQYERVRTRQHLAGLGEAGVALSSLLVETATATFQLEQMLPLEEMAQSVGLSFCPLGTGRLNRATLLALPTPSAETLLRHALFAINGAPYMPPPNLGKEALAAIEQKKNFGGGGFIVHVGETVTMLREVSALLGRKDGHQGRAPMPVQLGQSALWDRRFIVQISSELDEKDMVINALGRFLDPLPNNWYRLASLPVLSQGNRILALPHAALKWIDKFPVKADLPPWNSPPFDLHIHQLTKERFEGRTIRFS